MECCVVDGVDYFEPAGVAGDYCGHNVVRGEYVGSYYSTNVFKISS